MVNVFDFLSNNGFNLVENKNSSSFGDFYKILSNDFIELRFLQSKSSKSIDIKRNISSEQWFDLALVKALLFKEIDLTKVTDIEEYTLFLKCHLEEIMYLFDEKNYSKTKAALVNLGNARAKQMFGNYT